MDSSRADRLQGFASCFLSAAVPGGASIVKVEAAGGGGTTLTSAVEPYNGSGKHEACSADSFCCPDSSLAASLKYRWPLRQICGGGRSWMRHCCGKSRSSLRRFCGNPRWRLRRSCGKISSKPAASVVDQLLTNVRGQASLLFYGFHLQRICAPRFEHFDRHLREHRLLRATVFPSSSRRNWLQADSSPAQGGVSVIGRNAGFEFALSAPFVVWFGR